MELKVFEVVITIKNIKFFFKAVVFGVSHKLGDFILEEWL